MKPCCFRRNHLLTLMKPQGNWNCSNNAFIFDPHATHITNSNDHGITDTFPDTLYDIHRVDSVSIKSFIYEIIYLQLFLVQQFSPATTGKKK